MRHQSRSFTILVEEDDPNDRLLDEEAFRESGLGNNLYFVQDSEELLHFLRQQGSYTVPESRPRPDLILLNMNILPKDGREALTEIKADPKLRCIPVVVLTNSKTEEDVLRTYDLGGAGFIVKPVTFEGLVEVVKVLGRYWFEIVELPYGGRVKNVSPNNSFKSSSG
jgi:two-component system, response regulator